MKKKLVIAAFSVVLLSWPKIATAQCSTYGGRATVVQASGLNITPVVLSDTGNINSTGGINDASLLNASVPGLLTAEVMSATAGGVGSFSASDASLATVNLTVAGNTIGAGFAAAYANASCASGSPTVKGSAEIDGLVVNGLSITVTGSPNQTVSLLGGGYIILNEQTSDLTHGSITVNAMHVTIPGIADVVIASSFAAISGQLVGSSRGGGGPVFFVGLLLQTTGFPCGNLTGNFFTGGGWITGTPSGDKGTFGVSGGAHNDGTVFGHLEYVDHGPTMINVHGTGVPTTCFGAVTSGAISSFTITGTADVNGQSGCTYSVTVTDDDTSGTDTFTITVTNGGSCTLPSPLTSPYIASGPLGGGGNGGGNIEFHPD